MNSYERFFARLEGKEVDRIPNTCLFMTFGAHQIGVPFGKYVTDYRLLSQGVLKCYEKFHQDMLCVISDPMREAQALGAKVVIPEDDIPFCREKRVQTITDICTLRPVKPESSERTCDRLEAVRFLREKVNDEVPVVGWVEGAVAEACDLTGVSEFMIMMMDETEASHELLEICMEQSRLFALGQIQAGAKVKLHICGNISPVFHSVAKTGADIIDLDYMVDMGMAVDIVEKTCCLCGNFDPVSVLLQGTFWDVKQAVKVCISYEKQNPLFISAGCEVPKFTPEENVRAISAALCER